MRLVAHQRLFAAAWIALVATGGGCGPDDGRTIHPPDAGLDAAVRPSSDSGVLPPPDAGPDAGPDASSPDASVDPPPLEGVRLAEDDRGPHVALSADGRAAEMRSLTNEGVRSSYGIAPGQGVYYFEAMIAAPIDLFSVGVATADHPLAERPMGAAEAFGLDTAGGLYSYQGDYAGGFSPETRHVGFVLDYRGDHPVVHVLLDDGAPRLAQSETLDGIRGPLYAFAVGLRRTVGPHVVFNFGRDTVNEPFHFDPRALLEARALGATAEALVLGFGATHAAPYDAPPTVSASASSLEVPLGETVAFEASALDAEQGDLSATVTWEVLSTGYGAERVRGEGATFAYTPSVIGVHPVRATVVDAAGKTASVTLDLRATGALMQWPEVRLTPDATSGRGIRLSGNGLRAKFTATGKYAVRANQGLYGDFWYFEARRLIDVDNEGIGLVIGGASLDPYVFNETPPSCSVNVLGGVFQNLIYRGGVPEGIDHYGFAVDYRGRSPIVYVILEDRLAEVLQLRDATVPIYPMLYGSPAVSEAAWYLEANFGGAPFAYDPVAALSAAGVDASALRLCWGRANRACADETPGS